MSHPVFDLNSRLHAYRLNAPAVCENLFEEAMRRAFLLSFPRLETSAGLHKYGKVYEKPRALYLKEQDDLRYVVLNGVEHREGDRHLHVKLVPEHHFAQCTVLLLSANHLEQLTNCTVMGVSDPVRAALSTPRITESCRSTLILASLPLIKLTMPPDRNALEFSICFGDVVDGWPNKASMVLLFSD